jgi:CBS domain containing-hemolysin-like protein
VDYLALIVLLICLLAGATLFFSVNSITLRIFSRAKLQQALKAAKKPTSEDLTDNLVKNGEKLVLTCSLYRLIANCGILLLLLALFASLRRAAPQFTDYLYTFIIALAIFSVFGLAIPHAWAKYAGEKILSRTYKILMFFAVLAAPALFIWKFIDTLVRRLAGVAKITPQEQQEEKQEEFLNGLERHRSEGVLDKEQQEMIESVLELSETCADEIMTPRTDIVAVEFNSDLNAILETIITAGHTRVPVYEENIDNIVGLIYAKDLLTQIGKDPADFKVSEKIRDAYFVPETKPIRELLHEFQNQKLHIAVVLDEYGGTAGIVTLEDILEELVGEITDEYEKSAPKPVRKIDKDTFEVDARTYVDDLNDQFELNLPEEEDYDTVGGFVFSHLGSVPKTGETFDYKSLKFTIISADIRKIKRIRIEKLGQE